MRTPARRLRSGLLVPEAAGRHPSKTTCGRRRSCGCHAADGMRSSGRRPAAACPGSLPLGVIRGCTPAAPAKRAGLSVAARVALCANSRCTSKPASTNARRTPPWRTFRTLHIIGSRMATRMTGSGRHAPEPLAGFDLARVQPLDAVAHRTLDGRGCRVPGASGPRDSTEAAWSVPHIARSSVMWRSTKRRRVHGRAGRVKPGFVPE